MGFPILAEGMAALKGAIGQGGTAIGSLMRGQGGARSASQVIADAAETGKPGMFDKLKALSDPKGAPKGAPKEDPNAGFDATQHQENQLNSGPFLEAKQLADHWDTVAAQRTSSLSLGFGHNHLLQ